jgi:hypothetical protein
MKFSMKGHLTDSILIQVTAWAGLTILQFDYNHFPCKPFLFLSILLITVIHYLLLIVNDKVHVCIIDCYLYHSVLK